MARPGYSPVPDDVRARDVDNVGVELAKIAPDARRNGDRNEIFGPLEHRNGRDADEVASRRKSRMLDGGRIDAYVRALPQEIADEAVQGLVGAVADVIVIAR